MTLRAFHPVRAFPDMAEADVPRAYDALRVFSEVAADPQFQLRYPFRPGDVVGFDNRRILHGRDGYESSGVRHLRGVYIDRDEVLSFVRVSARRRWEVATGAIGGAATTGSP
jgi:gamma-butyrobetaine dioxygenase